MRTLRGEAVDRPAVSFYEIGGFEIDPHDPDDFNIYNDASWQPLLELAEEQTDLIRMRAPNIAERSIRSRPRRQPRKIIPITHVRHCRSAVGCSLHLHGETGR